MPTLLQYRQMLGAALGFQAALTTTSGAVNTTDLICSTLIDSDFEASFLDGVWSIVTSTASASVQVRRIKSGGLAPATGTITHTRAFSSTVSTAAAFELYGVLPPTDQLGRRGLLSCMNLALKECWIEDLLSITGVANQYQYSLSAYPWLQQEDQVMDVFRRTSSMTRDQLVSEWRFIHDADVAQLEFKVPFSTSDTLKPYVHRPMDTWIGVHGAAYTESSVGLVNDDDTAVLSLDGMRTVALVHCYESLATVGDESERSAWRKLAETQRAKANLWKRSTLKRDTGRDVHWRTTWSALAPAFPLEGSLST